VRVGYDRQLGCTTHAVETSAGLFSVAVLYSGCAGTRVCGCVGVWVSLCPSFCGTQQAQLKHVNPTTQPFP
jgi:hypothetical protein